MKIGDGLRYLELQTPSPLNARTTLRLDGRLGACRLGLRSGEANIERGRKPYI